MANLPRSAKLVLPDSLNPHFMSCNAELNVHTVKINCYSIFDQKYLLIKPQKMLQKSLDSTHMLTHSGGGCINIERGAFELGAPRHPRLQRGACGSHAPANGVARLAEEPRPDRGQEDTGWGRAVNGAWEKVIGRKRGGEREKEGGERKRRWRKKGKYGGRG